jgi:hypothetical protein
MVAAGLWACGAGDPADANPGNGEASPTDGQPSDEVVPAERDVAPVARFRFIDTAEGMAVEAASEERSMLFLCPQRSCNGMCDECAAEACRASGESAEACQFLVSSCADTCNCASGEPGCGFPVCAFDRMICYVEDETLAPNDPGDPNPFDSAGRPSESSSNTSRPAY